MKNKIQKKIAIMGGTFDPFHIGHKNSIQTLLKKFDFDKLILIPSYQNPLKKNNFASSHHRLEMLKKAFNKNKKIVLDDQEIQRQGLSYSYQTINNLIKKEKNSEFYLIMGMDQFKIFDQWKYFAAILKKAHLIVTTRAKEKLPQKLKNCPKGLKPFLRAYNETEILLKKDFKTIYLCPLKDRDISSSFIRKKIKNKEPIDSFVPKSIVAYIEKYKLYNFSKKTKQNDLDCLVTFCKEQLIDKKAFDVQVFNLKTFPLPFEKALLASASNRRQVQSLAKHLKKNIKNKWNLLPLSEEGMQESQWMVLDYGELVVHIFYDYIRDFYNLEELWKKPRNKV